MAESTNIPAETIHVGKLIEKLVEKKPMRKNDFARKMNYSASNVSTLFAREDWYLSKIMQASIILGENILLHFIGQTGSQANMAMEESPVYLVGKQGEQITRLTEEIKLQKETIRQLLLTNRLMEEKLNAKQS